MHVVHIGSQHNRSWHNAQNTTGNNLNFFKLIQVLPLPFLFTSPYAVGFHGDSSSIWNSTTANTTGNLSDFQPGDWKGTVAPEDTGIWIDTAMLLIFGDIPWQVGSIQLKSKLSNHEQQK